MSILNPLPAERLVDVHGRPYFLWDVEMTLEEFRRRLEQGTEVERAYLLGKLMRQARPDDVFTFVTPARMRAEWPMLERYLGKSRAFWRWLLDTWEAQGVFETVFLNSAYAGATVHFVAVTLDISTSLTLAHISTASHLVLLP